MATCRACDGWGFTPGKFPMEICPPCKGSGKIRGAQPRDPGEDDLPEQRR